jgi:hypothetical protein
VTNSFCLCEGKEEEEEEEKEEGCLVNEVRRVEVEREDTPEKTSSLFL